MLGAVSGICTFRSWGFSLPFLSESTKQGGQGAGQVLLGAEWGHCRAFIHSWEGLTHQQPRPFLVTSINNRCKRAESESPVPTPGVCFAELLSLPKEITAMLEAVTRFCGTKESLNCFLTFLSGAGVTGNV